MTTLQSHAIPTTSYALIATHICGVPRCRLAPLLTASLRRNAASNVATTFRGGTLVPTPRPLQPLIKMALPKSMRYLAGATICVFLYLFVQILKPGSETPIQIPSKLPTNQAGDWDHDPQLDRKRDRLQYGCDDEILNAFRSVWRTSRAVATS